MVEYSVLSSYYVQFKRAKCYFRKTYLRITLVELHVNLKVDTRIQVFERIVQSCYLLELYHCTVQFVKKTDDIKVI